MALKAKITKEEFDALPEPHREFYKAAGDGHVLDVEGVDDRAELKAAIEKERRAATEAKKQTADLIAKYRDLDPDKAREALTKLEEAEQEEAKKTGNFQAILDAANKKWEAERKQFQDLIAKKEVELADKEKVMQGIVVDQALTAAIAKHKGEPAILLPVIKNLGEIKAVLEGESYVPKVFDKEGNPILGDTKGNPMTPEQYVEQLRQNPTYARAFDGNGVNGGTGATGGGVGGNGNVIRLNREQVKSNPHLYAEAKERAAKSGASIEFDTPI